ncbi:putative Zinc finger protein [Plasmodium knowlesi]|uniref:Putative Zinc finger protein n=1 Tax=Plasmodium knowlesi TaxID=5850 RepID=A0A1Y3DLL3_PLAKN|nr:putative Zinc finger protein [Plasmodium knowlesi]
MSSFANNGGNYRNRTLGTSPKCQNINHKVTSVENGPSVFCTLCALPYNAKIRLNPCFHVICSKCYELCAQQQACLLCNVEINDVEFLFIGENIFVCPYGDCKKGFLNLKCFHYHIHFKHQFMKLGNYYTEDRSSSSISDRQNARGDTLSFPINEPFSTSFFSNNDGLNAYTASNEDDQEFNYESAKNEPSGSATNITISRAPGKWDYGNVPFKSDFNTFNMPPNSDALAPSKNNSLGPSGKENEEDDYDNLEDLM